MKGKILLLALFTLWQYTQQNVYAQATSTTNNTNIWGLDSGVVTNLIELDERDTLIAQVWIDTSTNISVKVSFTNKTVTFYKQKNNRSVAIGGEKLDISPAQLFSKDLDGDDAMELLVQTGRNMNGNQFMNVFKYNAVKDSVVSCGSLSTDYFADTAHKLVKVFYEGSSYMSRFFEVYKWYGDKLICLSQVELIPVSINVAQEKIKWNLEYYKNLHPPNRKLSCIFRVPYNEKTPYKYDRYWDETEFRKQIYPPEIPQLKK